MKNLIQALFEDESFDCRVLDDDLFFCSSRNRKLTAFYLLNYIDCTLLNYNETVDAVKYLENQYINEEYSLRDRLSTLVDNNHISQIDKNTSAIYFLRLSDVLQIDRLKKIILDTEESPKFFKRYVLPYTDKQYNELKTYIVQNSGLTLKEVLSNFIKSETNYFEYMNGKNLEGAYGLVLRLFAKLPFLQYESEPVRSSISINDLLQGRLTNQLKLLDEHILDEKIMDEEYLLEFFGYPSEKNVEDELHKILKENGL